MNALVYQKTIYGCHQCPNANEKTLNGRNRVCAKDIANRLVGKYIKEKRYPGWCPISKSMDEQTKNLQRAMEQNWREQS